MQILKRKGSVLCENPVPVDNPQHRACFTMGRSSGAALFACATHGIDLANHTFANP